MRPFRESENILTLKEAIIISKAKTDRKEKGDPMTHDDLEELLRTFALIEDKLQRHIKGIEECHDYLDRVGEALKADFKNTYGISIEEAMERANKKTRIH